MLTVIIGKSGSGKTEIAKWLERLLGINRIKGYTTRPKRDELDDDYVFVSEGFYKSFYEKWTARKTLCETEIDGYHYWKHESEIIGDNQTIIVNPEGLRELYETDIELVVINLVADYFVRYNRISEELISSGIKSIDICEKTFKRINRDAGFECLKVDWTVDANRTIEEVYADVKKIIEMQ